MKKILVPVSFSDTSRNALIHAFSIAKQYGASLSLLHAYPHQEYNREYDFGEEDYDLGIRRMLKSFYNESIKNNGNHRYNLITYSGSFSDIISGISQEYDLLIMSRKTGFQASSNKYFSDKLFYISTKSRCSVLICSTSQNDFSFQEAKNIWHIQRSEKEKEVIYQELGKLGIDPGLIVTKSLSQKKFVSDFWKNIVNYTVTHNSNFLQSLPQYFDKELIELLVFVNRKKGAFDIFIKDDAFQLISQFDIPILILQPKMTEK